MKRYLRWLGIVFLGLIITLVVIFITIWLHKDDLVNRLKQEINDQLEVDVQFDSYKVRLFQNFPDATFRINELSFTGRDTFKQDTLLFIQVLDVEVDLWSLVRQPFIVETIEIDQAVLKAVVLENGQVNWSVFPENEKEPESDTPANTPDNGLEYHIKQITFKESAIQYIDDESSIYSDLSGVEIELKREVGGLFWQSTVAVPAVDLTIAGIPVMQQAKGQLDAELNFEPDSFKLTLGQNSLRLNEMVFGLTGFASMPDTTIFMDIAFQSSSTSFKNLLSLLPYIYRTEFDDLKATGTFDFSGTVSGTYDALNFPETNLHLSALNGALKYPDLPKEVSAVSFDLKVKNTGGTIDGTIVDLSVFKANLGGDPVDLSFYMKHPESDPFVRTDIKVSLNLDTWKEFIPLDQTKELTGSVLAEIGFSGRVADAQNKDFDKIRAQGKLSGDHLVYVGSLFDQKLEVEQLTLGLTPERIRIDRFKAKAGQNDLEIVGSLGNYLSWIFDKGILLADLNVRSAKLNLNDWMDKENVVGEEKPETNPDPLSLPEDLAASIQLDIAELLYDKYYLTDIKGLLRIKEGVASMDPISFNTLGGWMEMKGSYASSKEGQKPFIDLDVQMKGVAMNQTVQTFNTVQKLAPIASRFSGQYSAGLKVRGNLADGFSPDLTTLNGLMQFRTDKLKIEQAEIVQQIGQLTGSGYFDSPTLSKVNALIEFHDGSVEIKPFTTKLKQAVLVIGGNQGLDGSLDYKIKVDLPTKELQFEKSSVAMQLFDLPLAKTVELKWPDRISFDALVSGSLKKPKVSLTVKDQFRNVKDMVVEKLKDKATEEMEKLRADLVFKAETQAKLLLEEANKQGEKLVSEARKKADQLQSLADQQIDKLKTEADRQADDLIAKAGANPIKKLAADQAAQIIRKEAETNASRLKNESAEQADRLIQEAKNKKTQIVEKARKEGENLIQEARTKPLDV